MVRVRPSSHERPRLSKRIAKRSPQSGRPIRVGISPVGPLRILEGRTRQTVVNVGVADLAPAGVECFKLRGQVLLGGGTPAYPTCMPGLPRWGHPDGAHYRAGLTGIREARDWAKAVSSRSRLHKCPYLCARRRVQAGSETSAPRTAKQLIAPRRPHSVCLVSSLAAALSDHTYDRPSPPPAPAQQPPSTPGATPPRQSRATPQRRVSDAAGSLPLTTSPVRCSAPPITVALKFRSSATHLLRRVVPAQHHSHRDLAVGPAKGARSRGCHLLRLCAKSLCPASRSSPVGETWR